MAERAAAAARVAASEAKEGGSESRRLMYTRIRRIFILAR